jgi:tetratricopeptide (TPR) repeat protein
MGYFTYYLALMAISYVVSDPRLLVGFIVLFVAHRWLPDPVVWLRSWRRSRVLRAQIAVNRSNATARRDLARVLLDWGRHGAALELLDEALERSSNDAELHYYRGRALLGAGRFNDALDALGRALELDAGVGHAEPYLLAGDAHRGEGRLEEAEEAYEHFVQENHSHIGARRKLADVRAALGHGAEARRTRDEAIATFAQLPGYLRRKQLGQYLRLRMSALFGA